MSIGAHPRLRTAESGQGRVHLLHVAGAIDGATDRQFHSALFGAIAASNGPLVVDMGRVTTIDAAGIETLFAARIATANRSRTFALVVGSPVIRRFLALCAGDAPFAVYPDVSAAVAAFKTLGV